MNLRNIQAGYVSVCHQLCVFSVVHKTFCNNYNTHEIQKFHGCGFSAKLLKY